MAAPRELLQGAHYYYHFCLLTPCQCISGAQLLQGLCTCGFSACIPLPHTILSLPFQVFAQKSPPARGPFRTQTPIQD